MPSKSSDPLQYLIDAISGSVKINIPEIATGYFPKDNTQTVVHFKGKSSVVFAFQLQKKLKAIKIWPAPVSESLRNHYRIIEDYLQHAPLKYFTGITYLEGAITIKDCQHDVLLMNWVGRQNIKEYIIANIDQKELLDQLAEKICRLHNDLNTAGIAHSHLHTGNIYIDTNNELKLIDYDSLYIKGLTEERDLPQNFPDYCHPSFSVHQKLSVRTDYFSALLLYLGTKAIAYNTILWGRYKVGFQENFLFTAADFLDLKNSSIYKYIRKTGSPEIVELLEILAMYCEEKDPDNLQPFYTYLKNDLQPVANPIAAIENIAGSNNPPKSNQPDRPKPLVHITMPAQAIIDEQEETKVIIAAWPVEETKSSDDTIALQVIHKNLPPEPVLITDNNNQNLEEVKNIAAQVVNRPVDSVKKITATERKPGKRDGSKTGVSKNHKAVIAIGLFFIGAAIIAAIYFLGISTGDKSNAITFPSAKTTTQQAKEPIENAVTETIHNTIKDIPATDSATANTIDTIKPGNTIAKNDSISSEPAATKVDSLVKTAITDADNQSPDTSATIAGKQPPVNDSTVNEQNVKNAAHKPAVVKNDAAKKQTSNVFEIGAVPKQ